jgi:hypothetical protein
MRQRRLAARRQPAAPAQAAPRRGPNVDVEDLVDVEVAPHLGQLLDLFRIRFLSRGNEGGVDAAGRDAGEDVGNGGWKFARQVAQHPNLIGGARAAATQHQRKAPSIVICVQIANASIRVRGRQRLRRAHRPTGHDGCASRPAAGFRLLLRAPGFAMTAILTLALGIGATTALFHRRQRRAARAAAVSRLEQADPGVAQ